MVRCISFILLMGAFSAGVSAQTLPQEGLRKINGTSLYVKTIGKGEPLLVIHGGPGMNHTYFLPHLNTLTKKYKLIFFDQRASGQSAVPHPDSISLDIFIEDIEGIRKEFKTEKLNLLAHSWGAIPAMLYAVDYPEHINKIILANPAPLSSEYNPELSVLQQKRLTKKDSLDRSQIMNSMEFKDGRSEAYRKLLMLSFRHSFFKPANFNKLQYTMPSNYVLASRALFTGLGKDLGQYNYYEKIKDVTAPLLLIHGAADVIPVSIQKRLTTSVPQSTLLVFKSSGHFSFIDEPERFRKEVTAFLLKK